MTQIDALVRLVRAYAAATGLAEAMISRRFLGAGGRLARLVAGGDIGVLTIAKTIEKFAQNWPDNAVWPEGVPRQAAEPEPERRAAAG